MAVDVECPHCGTTYRIAPDRVGHSTRCKKCERAFSLGSSADNTRGSQEALETGRVVNSEEAVHPPRKFGRFEIRRRLGAGAYGTVFLAFDPLLERELALKVPNPGALATKDSKARYLREPKAAAQLRHPNIVPVFAAGFDNDLLFIASAYIEGKTLQHEIEEHLPDLRHAVTLVMKLASALQYAHDQGIVHRDVKPANVMLDKKGDPLLTDFGLAQIRAAEDQLTHDGTVLGTPAYMSPEQASGQGDQVGPASDQYSLGVVLYELLSGERPFSGPPALVISLVRNQEPESPRKHNPKIPKDLETICLKAMAKATSGRYESCSSLADDLRRWLDSQPIHARRAHAVERFARWCQRNPMVAGLAGACLIVLLLGIAASSFFAIQANHQAKDAIRNATIADANAVKAELTAAEAFAAIEREKQEKVRADEATENAISNAVQADKETDAALAARQANQANLQERITAAVEAMSTARGVQVPLAIKLLNDLPREMVLSEMQIQFEIMDENRKLLLAYALADYEDVRIGFLVSRIESASPDEVDNFVAALNNSGADSVFALETEAQTAGDLKKWRYKARLAMLALHLNAPSLGKEMCQLGPDPIQRTLFIEECSIWHGDLSTLAKLVADSDDGPLRSGIALAVGSAPAADMSFSGKLEWETTLTHWYTTSPDTGTHSAADWALRKWNLELPKIAVSKQPAESHNWHVNSVGMTMLKIPAGRFVRKDENDKNANSQTVILTQSFLLADREVTRAQFQQFMDDADCPNTEKPELLEESHEFSSPYEQDPVQKLSWYNAVLFCNWLSRHEGLTACYERTGRMEKIDNEEYVSWRMIPNANGYRLPTEAEWEYACRAGTETIFSHGDEELFLDRYAVYHFKGPMELPGSKLPNGWGLFDTHGNYYEWCQDRYGPFDSKAVVNDPKGAGKGDERVSRGGSCGFDGFVARSATRFFGHPAGFGNGFRLARTYP